MIKMSRAFTKHTTTVAYLELNSDGYWDSNNEWVKGVTKPPIPFRVTVTPVGQSDYASFGATLEARPEGERVATYLQFTSTVEMPMNSIIYYRGGKFKVTRVAEYRAANFHSVIAEDIRGKYG